MAEPAVGVEVQDAARLIGPAVMLVKMMPEVRRQRRLLLVPAIADRRGKGGVQREQHQQQDGAEAFHRRASITFEAIRTHALQGMPCRAIGRVCARRRGQADPERSAQGSTAGCPNRAGIGSGISTASIWRSGSCFCSSRVQAIWSLSSVKRGSGRHLTFCLDHR
jgi:hypothetical protein